ncbi:CPXCG motif-containing cysteine-rich protein [Marivirga atlantica]|jgi:transcription elongation factor Elf1|uniref:CPXCG motif-containing cysteine-rich protein n=1 Tax=Marivirga atlantica TaxID=1548457 RepID=A0A937DDF3_9BACT|nr:CPXCG motif-containing cysteine-rich protein [Marivirga atlantica]MBL0764162.1 CPXCG motif-containing cysteine-rich protein [Marivirga atlantica]
MIEHFFICPSCLQEVSVLIDPSIKEQSYIEDCEVCCRPLQINVHIEEGEVLNLHAELAQ